MAALPNLSLSSTSPVASPPFTISDSNSQFQLPSSTSFGSSGHPYATKVDSATSNQPPDVDAQILEALRSKDRIYVLKLGELMEGLINEQRDRISLTPLTSYQRLLVHRCSAYYKLMPESDPISKGIFVCSTPESRIPSKRLCELIQLESIAQPAFKIMRRSQTDRRPHNSQSQAGSVAGEDVDLSDVEPSESGSLGGRSNATGGSNKKRLTIEEREAAYNEARNRIFMDFEEKEKEKDMSASSSSISFVSGSASTSGGGSSVAGDVDETLSSPATESDYSAPSLARKGSRQISSGTSSRSLRPSAPPFNGNSRAPSPSDFTYATIYPTPSQVYDSSQHSTYPGQQPQYLYPYPPSRPPNPYVGTYPYYTPYNAYQTHQSLPQHSASDPPTPSNGDPYFPPPHSGYGHAYGWPGPPIHPPPMQHPSQLAPQHYHPNHVAATPPPPPAAHNPQYSSYVPLPPYAYTYPMSYYPPPAGQHMEPPPSQVSSVTYNIQKSINGHGMGNQVGNQVGNAAMPTMNTNSITSLSSNGRTSTRHSGHMNGGGKGQGEAPKLNQGRSTWSYDPNVGQGGYINPLSSTGIDTIGPRLSSSRRQSGNSARSSPNSRSSNDEVSSTASSSTTSSSSRRTYTSTTSSPHPLPPRPDWAVGLKPQPGPYLSQARHHDHHHHNSHAASLTSPLRSLNSDSSPNMLSYPSQQTTVAPPQSSADFPPLSSVTVTPEKRMPIVSGPWGNTRSIRMPSPGQVNLNSLGPHSDVHDVGASQEVRLDESDRGYERPPPKSVELFNPKVLRRPMGGKIHVDKDKDRGSGDAVANGILNARVESMTLGSPAATVCHDSSSVLVAR